MSSVGFLEMVLSLSVQIVAVIGVCAWLVRQTDADDTGHRLWGTCHAMILVVTLTAIFLPHLRLVPHSLLTDRIPLAAVAAGEHWVGGTIVVAWAAGAFLYAIAIVIGIVDIRRILTTAKPLLRKLDSVEQNVTVLVSSHVTSPFCWQMQRPVIVLPESARSFPGDELSAIIRHELAHLRSGHPLCLFLQRMVEMLFWFHPLVWWASRQAESQREFHCDLVSNRNSEETTSYLRSLLRLIEVTPERRFSLPTTLNFHGDCSLIRQRVDRLMLVHRHSVADDSRRRMGMVTIIAVSLLVTCLWLPVNVAASSRSVWSPWPTWSASALYEVGIVARDYEVDGHRLRPHELTEPQVRDE